MTRDSLSTASDRSLDSVAGTSFSLHGINTRGEVLFSTFTGNTITDRVWKAGDHKPIDWGFIPCHAFSINNLAIR